MADIEIGTSGHGWWWATLDDCEGRASSFRIAYQAALHDLAAMTAERDAALRELDAARFASAIIDNDLIAAKVRCEQLHTAVNFEAAQRRMRHKAWLEEKARADAAEAEVKRLRPMLDYAASKMELNAECVAAFRAGADAEKDGSHIIESLDSSAKNVRAALAQKEASHD